MADDTEGSRTAGYLIPILLGIPLVFIASWFLFGPYVAGGAVVTLACIAFVWIVKKRQDGADAD